MEAILQLDGAKTVQQITSLEGATTPAVSTGTSDPNSARDTNESVSSHVKNGQTASSGVRKSALSDQDPSLAVSDSDLDSLASKAAGVAKRYVLVIHRPQSQPNYVDLTLNL